ncbi:MAG: glutaminyl-peptide cyclotransferase [Myxococcales bacterium]|nr:glutaminyl-peptide cyclotransferase [Myxococcales bacterium]
MTRRTLALIALLSLVGCRDRTEVVERVQIDRAPKALAPERLRVEVVRRLPHDVGAFTQGLLIDEGRLFESTGLVGESTLREVDLESGRVIRRRDVPPPHFGEGLVKVGDELILLTWQTGKAFRFRAETFEPLGEHDYEGEGWGLTFDGSRLVMSDGSATLQFRDPRTFALLSTVDVRLEGRPVHRLNELEYARGLVWANVWQTDRIVAIDPATGNVVKVVDARGLLDRAERFRADVLNGIAYDSRRGAFYVTGKRWPWLFEVRFVPEEKNP